MPRWPWRSSSIEGAVAVARAPPIGHVGVGFHRIGTIALEAPSHMFTAGVGAIVVKAAFRLAHQRSVRIGRGAEIERLRLGARSVALLVALVVDVAPRV